MLTEPSPCHRRQIRLRAPAILLWLFVLAAPARAEAPDEVTVRVGPTAIPGGTASGPGDITVSNGRLAVAFAVDTVAPWGVPRGGIVDIAEVRDGVIGPDRAALLDFLPDSWSKWVAAQPRIEVIEDGGDRAVVRTERLWRGVRLTTTWRIEAGRSTLDIVTRMHNEGSETVDGALSGYVLWPEGGHLFGPPGLDSLYEGDEATALARWSAGYGEDWVLALHAPYAERMQDGGRDRYLRHDLAPGESRNFEARLQVEPTGSLAPLVAAEIAFGGLPAGRVAGRVATADGSPVQRPAVVAEMARDRDYQPYAWDLGQDGAYALDLPVGRYRLYATARGHADSRQVELDIAAGTAIDLDFDDLKRPGQLRIHVAEAADGRPLDARIAIEEGATPLIQTFGQQTFFTELDPAGQVTVELAPGPYHFRVESSAGFTARPAWLDASVEPGATSTARAHIEVLAQPAAAGWYAGDMHHHSDVLDGFTEPEYVMRSQLAAGLDVTLLSDHDSVVNNPEMSRLAALRSVPFIAGTELSPSWAHFNAYPLRSGEAISIDPGQSTVHEIFGEARRMGAEVVQINHPYLRYGYFRTADAGQVPGGYSDAFDLVEITASDLQANSSTLQRTWGLWTAGQRAYLSAGSDAHDVWQEMSGAARMYVKLDAPPNVERFIAALRRGNAYATTGPLVYPETLFGEDIRHPAGQPLSLGYRFQAVNGLASVALIERGREVEVRRFDTPPEEVELRFETWPESTTWYSLVAEDAAGGFLVSNPVWVEVEAAPVPASANPDEGR